MKLSLLLFLTTLFLTSTAIQAAPIAPLSPELKERLITAMADNTDGFDRFDAEVWLVDMSARLTSFLPKQEERLTLLRHLHFEARRAKLHPELVLAVIEVESRFDRFAISRVGARGLMQIMPFWLKEIGRPDDNLFISQTNLRFGCTILRYYLDMEKGDLGPALARYNGSLGSTRYPNKVVTALNRHWYRR